MSKLKINLSKINSQNIMAAKLWINEGSRADPDELKGIHQILSSVMSRGCGPYDSSQLAEIVENCGAILRCEAYEDGLLISLKCIKNDAYKLITLIGWMITEPTLEVNQIELEKNLTLKDIKRQRENSYQQAFDGWRQLAYKKGPYGHDPLGLISDIKNITKEKIIPISKSLIYRKKNLVISGSYPIDIECYIKESNAFDKIINQNLKDKVIPFQSNTKNILQESTENISTIYEDTQQVVILLGRPTVSYSNEADLPLRLIACYLGYGMSCLLFKTLREKYGVVYEVGVYHPIRQKETPFILHASTTEEKALITINLLNQCWKEVIKTEIDKEELNLVKTKFIGQMAHSIQSISQQAERKAHLLGMGLNINYDKEILTRIKKISSQELIKVARLYLKNPLLSVCGNEQVITKIEKEWKKSV